MTVKITRVWSMPSRWTFKLPHVKKLLQRYVLPGQEWADPFNGRSQWGTVTNDLNPLMEADYHLDAELFILQLPDSSLDGVLFDPPYSPRQIAECYKSIGRNVSTKDTQNAALYNRTRKAIMPKLKPGAIAISFGWNSVGFGVARGFEQTEILMICHGSAHNDTICVVEKFVKGKYGG